MKFLEIEKILKHAPGFVMFLAEKCTFRRPHDASCRMIVNKDWQQHARAHTFKSALAIACLHDMCVMYMHMYVIMSCTCDVAREHLIAAGRTRTYDMPVHVR